jgi:hypothetical protein
LSAAFSPALSLSDVVKIRKLITEDTESGVGGRVMVKDRGMDAKLNAKLFRIGREKGGKAALLLNLERTVCTWLESLITATQKENRGQRDGVARGNLKI